ncbi:MAG: hybrid sensor histidine kinase/response regulator [Chloroflexota bacterium]|nr:MAG: hybrid sensor histidine kinase/response regulator [Chloroflexota bacterium]
MTDPAIRGRLRVLVLEDNPLDAELVVRELSRGGRSVAWVRVETEREFVANLSDDIDIILVDYALPRFDAIAAIERVRRSGLDIPLIVVTGAIDDAVAVECLRAGAADYLLKDRLARLDQAVDRAIAERRERRERAAAGAALSETEARLRRIAENAHDVIFRLDLVPTVRFTYISPASREVLGYAPDELMADTALATRTLRLENLVASSVSSPHIGANPRSYDYVPVRSRHTDGREVWLDHRQTVVLDDDDQVVAIEGIVRDVTAQYQAERTLREARERMAQSEKLRALGQMASGVAHDFNNQLSLILGYAELLLARPGRRRDDGALVEDLQAIHTAAEDAAAVVRRLQMFYRPTESEGPAATCVHLNAIVAQAMSATEPRWRDQARMAGVVIDVLTDLADIPPTIGDAIELREMLTNLIFNAVDAMQSGGRLTFSTRADGGHIVLCVTDTGVGMPTRVIERAFEPFFTTKGERGTGLGLSMVYGVVERHNGTIAIESAPGQGTTFMIRLPIVECDEGPIVEADQMIRSAPRRVLLIDDDPAVCRLIARILADAGHLATVADGCADAFSHLATSAFDVIIADSALPSWEGDHPVIRMRTLAPVTPVLLLAGFGETSEITAEPSSHVAEVVDKPIRTKRLLSAVARVTG